MAPLGGVCVCALFVLPTSPHFLCNIGKEMPPDFFFVWNGQPVQREKVSVTHRKLSYLWYCKISGNGFILQNRLGNFMMPWPNLFILEMTECLTINSSDFSKPWVWSNQFSHCWPRKKGIFWLPTQLWWGSRTLCGKNHMGWGCSKEGKWVLKLAGSSLLFLLYA